MYNKGTFYKNLNLHEPKTIFEKTYNIFLVQIDRQYFRFKINRVNNMTVKV